MFNFLHPNLMPRVSCETASTDHYEPSNLLSPNEIIRARGYLAYSVIKPPVTLDFDLLCPVNISYISLNSTVGNQKCTGIEVFAKNSTKSYMSIGKAFYDKSGVCFCNSRKYSRAQPPPGFNGSESSLNFFKSDTFRFFTQCEGIRVVIFRTERTVPCLKAIQVFGCPARGCTRTTVDTINTLMGLCPIKIPAAKSDIKPEIKSLKIPEDFTDALTCELMALPMTLPSGKTIDRDTLEKHVENEQSFGRKPGDPFTGLKFTDTRKAVMNVALKSRIDMFLLQNSTDPVLYGVKRTIGSCGDSGNKRYRQSFKSIALPGDEVKCCVCDKDDILYLVPCKHFYCRACLVQINVRSKCGKCRELFQRNDAQRYFT